MFRLLDLSFHGVSLSRFLSPALRVCEEFVKSAPAANAGGPRAFVYISAEDCNRPLVPAGYIQAKREAELGIERMLLDRPGFRGVYIRPSASPFLSSLLPSFLPSFLLGPADAAADAPHPCAACRVPRARKQA